MTARSAFSGFAGAACGLAETGPVRGAFIAARSAGAALWVALVCLFMPCLSSGETWSRDLFCLPRDEFALYV